MVLKKVSLVNLMLLYVTFFSLNACSQNLSGNHTKIPIDPKRWYQLTNASKGLDELFDDKVYTCKDPEYSSLIKYYDSYYPLLNGESFTIEQIRFFDGMGTANVPMKVFIIDEKWNRKLIATFNGSSFGSWVGPNPERAGVFKLDVPVKNARYLVIKSGDVFPNEFELIGSYTQPKPTAQKEFHASEFKNFIGVNAYEWDFQTPELDPYNIDESKFNVIKNFTSFRHYMDWEKLESSQGKYTFSPTREGGWNYDTIYQRCKEENIEVLACLKTVPKWILATYPEKDRDYEVVPVKYGMDFSDPRSYIEQAKVAFQFAARYGKNKNIENKLISIDSVARFHGSPTNKIKKGLGYINYIECDNERDKTWKGRKAYQTAREYAANLSAFYDGHKKTLGPNAGVKNADSTMQVVIGGIASADQGYIMGMIDWCKEFRGYKKDGSVDLCWDVINFHFYANDSQNKRGMAPEKVRGKTNAEAIAKSFVDLAHTYAGDMPVWVTETGYDINSGSPNRAMSIGHKSALETQADWTLRTSLLFARNGIDRVFYYQLKDDASESSGMYATSGLVNKDLTLRPAANFLQEVNKSFGNYRFNKQIKSNPIVDEYVNGNSSYMYVVYLPEETGREALCNLSFPKSTSGFIYRPNADTKTLNKQEVEIVNNSLQVIVSETPLFLVVGQRVISTIH